MTAAADTLSAAIEYCRRGWSVIPLQGKLARIPWKEYQKERADEAQVRIWWAQNPDSGVGIVLGRVSGVMRVDADGPEALEKLTELGGLPPTSEFVTPTGGRGYLLKYLEGATTEVLWKGNGEHQELRVQSDGAYTVLPPSPHPAGGFYVWVSEEQPAAVPRWLRDMYVSRVLQDLAKELRPTLRQPDRTEILECLEHIGADDYDMWVQVGMALKSVGDEYLSVWIEWSQRSPKFAEGECERKWATFRADGCGLTARSLFHWAEQESGWRPANKHEPLTDLGNARVLARLGEGRIKHSSKWGWLAWDGVRWALEGAEKVVQELQKAALEYRLNAAVESLARHLKSDPGADGFDGKRRSKIRTIAAIRKHEEESRIRGARTLAESEPVLSCDYRKFDVDPWTLNCANGTLDLRTLELHEHRNTDLLTQLCPTEYIAGAQGERWCKFLEEILPDEGIRKFLQQFLGACLTGDVTPQVMPVLWGAGSNGKSTLVNAVISVLGDDYAMKAKRDLLMVKRGTEHPTSVARLRGKRLVACVESSEDGRLDETLVKELTGGDRIAARRMREDEWEFYPTHKLVLVTNHKPEVRGTDDAVWRRLPLVPFDQRFAEDDPRRDPGLTEALRSEASGVLSWMVEGCRVWLAAGRRLERPGLVKEATAAYREEQDLVGTFISDRCRAVVGAKARFDKLVEAYTLWCHANKHKQLDSGSFGRALTERGYPVEAKGSKYRTGLELQT